jgi:dihydroorotase
MESLSIRRPDDFHVHLRRGAMLEKVLPFTSKVFARAVVMPNVKSDSGPHILDAVDIRRYRTEILKCLEEGCDFEPLMTFSITDQTDFKAVLAARGAGAIAGKLYPVGSTTNSTVGCSNLRSRNARSVFAAMQEIGIPLLLHGEDPGTPAIKRESAFLPNLDWLVENFPELKIVLEHVSTGEGVVKVQSLPDTVAATITPHHLMLTLDDIIGGSLNPHHFCKPVAKTASDREVLRVAATSGNPKFFLGTDSAPHSLRDKREKGAAGIFCAPTALPLLAELFEERGKLNRLEDFVSRFGAEFYGLPLNEGQINLVRRPCYPEGFKGVLTFMEKHWMQWRVENS